MTGLHKWIALTIALALTPYAQAQVFKCSVDGKTVFSDRPCGTDSKQVRAAPTASAAAPATLPRWGDACLAQMDRWLKFKDPDSIKVGAVVDRGADTTKVAGKTIMVKKFTLYINAKNGFGAYGGEEPFLCETSIDGYRVISIR
ncbi:MAG TPA: DUF4124 domain-containing protein [Rhodocyclaceae bacterium]|nr:DUF4124 domain-containing protein [Rhodocyclaceae bacterium]